ncbi:MAG: DMT family transporter [Eubacteriales bacterium]|nr:DMT family transporter [Eubacteriales bacterium]
MKKFFSNKYICAITAVICTLLWGTAYPLIKLAYTDMSIETVPDKLLFAGLRFFIAGLMVFLVCAISRKNVFDIERNRIPKIILYSLLLTVFHYTFNYIGVGNASATKTSVLASFSAFLGVLLAPLFFKKEKLSRRKIAGCLVGAAGVIIVNLSFFEGSFSFMGEGFILLATVCSATGSLYGKKVSQGKIFEVTAWQLFIGGAILCAISLFFSASVSFTTKGVFELLFLAFVSAASFSLWTALLVYNDSGKIMIYNLLIPVFGAMWSYIILGETEIFDPLYIVSLVLICGGITLVNISDKKRSHK